MKNSIVVFLFAVVLLAACSKSERETVSGQKFTVVRAGDGHPIDSGKFLTLNFLFKDSKDSIWNDTRKNDYPLIMQKQGIVRPGDKVLEVISMLTKGDSVTFKVSAKEIFTKSFRQPVPPTVDSTSSFTFVVGLIDALDKEQFDKYRNELIAKENTKMMKKQKAQSAKDSVLIDNYIKEKNLSMLSTASGIRYKITKAGSGANVKDGQSAKINYAGYLLNGKYFDTSYEAVAKEKNLYQQGRGYGPYEIVVGQSQVIQGWHEAAKLMNKGSKMTVIIPSTLAYGSQRRSEDIVENSILVFDLELVDIK
jgi:FKBP-type peptidyl-prolyl cis-trans isomerase